MTARQRNAPVDGGRDGPRSGRIEPIDHRLDYLVHRIEAAGIDIDECDRSTAVALGEHEVFGQLRREAASGAEHRDVDRPRHVAVEALRRAPFRMGCVALEHVIGVSCDRGVGGHAQSQFSWRGQSSCCLCRAEPGANLRLRSPRRYSAFTIWWR